MALVVTLIACFLVLQQDLQSWLTSSVLWMEGCCPWLGVSQSVIHLDLCKRFAVMVHTACFKSTYHSTDLFVVSSHHILMLRRGQIVIIYKHGMHVMLCVQRVFFVTGVMLFTRRSFLPYLSSFRKQKQKLYPFVFLGSFFWLCFHLIYVFTFFSRFLL